jgi:Tfp pilus assembly protein PilO
MNNVRDYRNPILIGAGTLVLLILIWVLLISPQNSQLSSLQAQDASLQTQQANLESQLTILQAEKQKISGHCSELKAISTQIPSVRTPGDIDAEESAFESQFNTLASSSGVTLSAFSGFVPPLTVSPTAGPAGVTAVPTTIGVNGNYGQVSAFINGLDKFPRLFVIQKFTLTYGAANAANGQVAANPSLGTATIGGTPLWTGGTSTPSSAGPYNLSIEGSIYYTSQPDGLAACSAATR